MTKTVTTTREYDTEGRVVKETVVELILPDGTNHYDYYYPRRTVTPWWQFPYATHTGGRGYTTNSVTSANARFTVDSAGVTVDTTGGN